MNSNHYNSETSWQNNKAVLPINSLPQVESLATLQEITLDKDTLSILTMINTWEPTSMGNAKEMASISMQMAIAMKELLSPTKNMESAASPAKIRANTMVQFH